MLSLLECSKKAIVSQPWSFRLQYQQTYSLYSGDDSGKDIDTFSIIVEDVDLD
jgi:hypothetical protein